MKIFKHGARQSGRALLCVAVLAALAACGGGGSNNQIVPFQPTRIIAFGDEASLILPKGKKFTVNALSATTGDLDCQANPIWVQSLAANFGMVFAECNPSNLATPQGLMYAQAGAKVDDVRAKIDSHFATNGFGPKDLVTVMAGANDLLELYRQFPAQSQSSLLDAARERGRALAAQINRIANADGRVLAVTLPDLGLTPFALKEKANHADTDRAAFLTALTTEFNTQMRLDILNDGRLIGLVLADEAVQAIGKYPGAFGYSNVTDPACVSTVAIQDCTTSTLASGATGQTWLWASDTLLGPGGQQRLAVLAQSRARMNPF